MEAEKTVKASIDEQDIHQEEYSKSEVYYVKPFDYEALRKQMNERGVVFLQKPLGIDKADRRFNSQRAIRNFFSDYGTVTRTQAAFEGKGNKKFVSGYYIEFERRSIAKRVALTLNGSPISPKDSRTLSIRYVANFSWSDYSEKDERVSMYKKLMRAEAEKELRTIKNYMKQKRLSSIMKKHSIKPKREFTFKQKYTDTGDQTGGNSSHIDVLPIL